MENTQKKILTVCFTALCIVLFLIYTMDDFNEEKGSGIKQLIGEEFGGISSLSIRENTILTNAVELYLNCLSSGDFDKAYGYITSQYKEIVPKEKYIEKMNEIGLNNFKFVKSISISQASTNMFTARVVLSNDLEQILLIILDDEKYYIVPEPFLEYRVVDEEITKANVTYRLMGYEVDLDKCIFYFSITNGSKEIVNITDAKMVYSTGGQKQAINNKVEIQPNETLNVDFEVDTYMDFPEMFRIERTDGDKIRIYTFEL